MEVITYPSKILRKKSKKITDFSNPELTALASGLIQTMKTKDGLGLAAPQVGKNIRIIAINTKKGDQIFINPKIISLIFFAKKELGEEGCLSFPQIYGMVKRAKKVKVKYQNLQGKKIKVLAEGLLARVFQHEIDHLKGILFIDKAKEIIKGQSLLEKMKNETKQ